MSETHVGTNGTKPPPAANGKKRIFDLAYKKKIGARCKKEGVSAVAAETGIHGSIIRRWMNGEGLGTFGHKLGNTGSSKKTTRKNKPVDESMGSLASLPIPVRDAIKFLKLANSFLYNELRNERIAEFDEAHDLGRMALRELLKLKDK